MMRYMPNLPAGIRLLSDPEREHLRLAYPTLPADPSDCSTCGGSKTFCWYDPESGHPTDWECNCVDQWILQRYFLYCGIGMAYQRLGWRDNEAEQGATDKVQTYLSKAPAYIRAGIGLVLHGNRGAGKTMLSCLAIKRLLADGFDCQVTTMIALLDNYTAGWRDVNGKAWFDQRIKHCQVLVVDDLGKEQRGESLPTSALDEVLRHRIAGGFPTWLTTNKTLEDLGLLYGGFVMSLLREQSTTYQFVGEDFRDRLVNRKADEIDAGLTRPIVVG